MGLVWRKAVLVVLAVAAVLAETGNGMSICNVEENRLKTCLPAVKKPNPTPPSSECCGAMGVVDMKCLCTYKHSPVFPALGIDFNLCMELPPKCGLTAPPC